MEKKYHLYPDPVSGGLVVSGFSHGETVSCSNFEDVFELIEERLETTEEASEYQHLITLLEDVVVWYTTKQPLLANLYSKEMDLYNIMDKLESFLEDCDDLASILQNRLIWFSRPETGPFLYIDEDIIILFVNKNDCHPISSESLETAREEILQIAEEQNFSPKTTAQILKDLERAYPRSSLLQRGRELDN